MKELALVKIVQEHYISFAGDPKFFMVTRNDLYYKVNGQYRILKKDYNLPEPYKPLEPLRDEVD